MVRAGGGAGRPADMAKSILTQRREDAKAQTRTNYDKTLRVGRISAFSFHPSAFSFDCAMPGTETGESKNGFSLWQRKGSFGHKESWPDGIASNKMIAKRIPLRKYGFACLYKRN
jgi:hypothetical protein